MKAHLERLCEHCGIVRAGPGCDHYGAPFENAAVAVFDGKWATLKALAKKPTFAQLKATIKELAAHGFRMRWERSESDGMREVITKFTKQESFTMSASIPVTCNGSLCVSADDVTVKKVVGQVKSYVDITGFTFPNGKTAPSGTLRSIYGVIIVPGRGAMGADYEQIAQLIRQSFLAPFGHVQNALLKQSGKTLNQMNDDVVDYRAFLDTYAFNPNAATERAAWLAMAQASSYAGVVDSHIDADLVRAAQPEAQLSMHTL